MATSLRLRLACKRSNFLAFATTRAFSGSQCQQKSDSPIGFIGLGNMGAHMAKNLIKNGRSLVVYDAVPAAINELKEAGSPAEVAAQTTRVVTMLPSSPHVLEVYSGDKGIFRSAQKGSLFLDSSTIDPMVSRKLAAEAENGGCVFMDAPVSGGVNAARDAILTFMVGGPESSFETGKEILSQMGKNIVHCGSIGTGQAAKICNNMLLGISMIGTSETMNLGIKLGLDPKLLASILNMSSGRCWSSEMYNPVPGVKEGVPSSNDYQGGFGTALMTKDLGLAQDAATNTKSPTPLGSLAHQIYRLMCNRGYATKDFSSAFLFLQEQTEKK